MRKPRRSSSRKPRRGPAGARRKRRRAPRRRCRTARRHPPPPPPRRRTASGTAAATPAAAAPRPRPPPPPPPPAAAPPPRPTPPPPPPAAAPARPTPPAPPPPPPAARRPRHHLRPPPAPPRRPRHRRLLRQHDGTRGAEAAGRDPDDSPTTAPAGWSRSSRPGAPPPRRPADSAAGQLRLLLPAAKHDGATAAPGGPATPPSAGAPTTVRRTAAGRPGAPPACRASAGRRPRRSGRNAAGRRSRGADRRTGRAELRAASRSHAERAADGRAGLPRAPQITAPLPGAAADAALQPIAAGAPPGTAQPRRLPRRAPRNPGGRPHRLHRAGPDHRPRSRRAVVRPSQRDGSLPLRRARHPDPGRRRRNPHHRDPSRRLADHHRDRPRRPVAAPDPPRRARPRDHHHRQQLSRSARGRRLLCRPAAAGDPHPLRSLHRRRRRRVAGPDLRDHDGAAGGTDRAALLARRNPLQPDRAPVDAEHRRQHHQLRNRIVGDSARSGGEAAGDRRRPQPGDPGAIRARCS